MVRISRRDLIIFMAVAIFIAITQFTMLAPHLNFGFHPDDVYIFTSYIQLGPNPLIKFWDVFKQMGPHGANPTYYDGILFGFFGFNYFAYQVAIFIFKILATLSIYLLIRIISNNRLLATLSAFVFAIHYGAVGAMEEIARTQDYLVIVALSIFFILYYYLITKKLSGWKWWVIGMVVLLVGFVINPIRAYPVLIFIILAELYFLFTNVTVQGLVTFTKKFLILFSPYILVAIISPETVTGPFTINTPTIYKAIMSGNLQLFLTPITSLGGLFVVGDSYSNIRALSWDNFSIYINYIFGGPLAIFGASSVFLSFIVAKKPIRFFFGVLGVTFLGMLAFFFIINNRFNIPISLRMHYDPATFGAPTVLGIYLLSVAFFVWREWKKGGSRESSIFNIWVGIIFTFLFWLFTWIFADPVTIPTGINGWATVPSIGASLAIAGVISAAYSKLKSLKIIKAFSTSSFLFLIPFLFMSNDAIQRSFAYDLRNGMLSSEQVSMRNKIFKFIEGIRYEEHSLIFIDKSKDYSWGRFYEINTTARPEDWHYLYEPKVRANFCSSPIWIANFKDELKKAAVLSKGKKGFLYPDRCGKKVFVDQDDFYAFKLVNKEVISVKEELLKEMEFKEVN